MTKPHKHAALIKLWADGAVIETRSRNRGDDAWTAMDGPGGDSTPGWFEDFEYRVKPEPELSSVAKGLIDGLILAAKRTQTGASDSTYMHQIAFDVLARSSLALRIYILSLENPE